ncbi:hypothetical protein H0H93_006056, partial [Arthromyces matolae]
NMSTEQTAGEGAPAIANTEKSTGIDLGAPPPTTFDAPPGLTKPVASVARRLVVPDNNNIDNNDLSIYTDASDVFNLGPV